MVMEQQTYWPIVLVVQKLESYPRTQHQLVPIETQRNILRRYGESGIRLEILRPRQVLIGGIHEEFAFLVASSYTKE